jgi:hypothetical protein
VFALDFYLLVPYRLSDDNESVAIVKRQVIILKIIIYVRQGNFEKTVTVNLIRINEIDSKKCPSH